jgi:hypothetical protein
MNPTFQQCGLNQQQNEEGQSTSRLGASKKTIAPVLALEEMLDDIERLIFHVVTPYVDDSNPMLHLDELCAECRFKLAVIINAGRMLRCPTRANFFGYLKVSFRNHVRTLVQKYVFTQRRGGINIPSKPSLAEAHPDQSKRTKSLHLSLDDENLGLQIGSNDEESRSWKELIEHLEAGLSPQEQAVMQHLKTAEPPHPQTRLFLECKVAGWLPKRPSWKLQRYAAEVGMTVEEFAGVMSDIRAKCRAAVVDD